MKKFFLKSPKVSKVGKPGRSISGYFFLSDFRSFRLSDYTNQNIIKKLAM